MENEKLGLETTRKLILCVPRYNDDNISKKCTTILKQIIKNHRKTNVCALIIRCL